MNEWVSEWMNEWMHWFQNTTWSSNTGKWIIGLFVICRIVTHALTHALIHHLFICFIHSLIHSCANSFILSFIHLFIALFILLFVQLITHPFLHSSNEWANEWTNEWANEQMNEWLNQQMSKCANEWVRKQTNKWTNEWMNKQSNEWTIKWVNEQMNEKTNESVDEQMSMWMEWVFHHFLFMFAWETGISLASFSRGEPVHLLREKMNLFHVTEMGAHLSWAWLSRLAGNGGRAHFVLFLAAMAWSVCFCISLYTQNLINSSEAFDWDAGGQGFKSLGCICFWLIRDSWLKIFTWDSKFFEDSWLNQLMIESIVDSWLNQSGTQDWVVFARASARLMNESIRDSRTSHVRARPENQCEGKKNNSSRGNPLF